MGVGKRMATKILIATMQGDEIGPAMRREAGLLLRKTGWLPDDLDLFLEVSPGTFFYGERKQKEEIPYHYWIGKYPVTNAQYARFVADAGYRCEPLWSRAGWDWRNRTGFDLPRLLWGDPAWDNHLFPVVGVRWYEAEAYAN